MFSDVAEYALFVLIIRIIIYIQIDFSIFIYLQKIQLFVFTFVRFTVFVKFTSDIVEECS